MSAEEAPLLACEDLRVDVDGVPACDGLSLRTTGERVLVLGAPRVVFEATCGLRPVARGRLAVRGSAPAAAVHDRVLAGAPLDPSLPPRWTPLEYATWSARLAGHGASEAKERARQAIARLQLSPLATTLTSRIAPHAKRATVVAAALATGAPVLALEDPLGGLAEEVWRTWARILVGALEGVSWIVFAPRIPLTSPLAFHADEAIVVSAPRVEAQGAPAEIAVAERRWSLRLHGDVGALAPKLEARGARIVPAVPDAAGPDAAHVVLDLGESLTTSELLGMCVDADVVVVELSPIARALA